MRSLTSKTGYKGVRPSGNRFRAQIELFGKRIHLGSFDTAKEAAEIYDAFREKYENEQSNFFSKNNSVCGRKHITIGVKHDFRHNKFVAYITRNYQCHYLGTFNTEPEAAIAVNKFLDSINDGGLRNDISINDIIEIKRAEKVRQAQLRKYEDEQSMRKPPTRIKSKQGPEYKIQKDIIRYLEDRGWLVRIITGGLYNFGFPDLWACHAKYGQRWIEVKNPAAFHFTAAQMKFFPKMIEKKVPIYILCAADEKNYKRLFSKSNLWLYLGGMNDGK